MRHLSTEEFIERARKKHGDRFDYSKTRFVNSDTKIIVTCKKHGDFTILPFGHLNRDGGCKQCSKEKMSERQTMDINEFVKRAKKVHGNKYDYSKVKYCGINSPVLIICPEHGEFWQKPFNHLNGCGCQECGKSKIWDVRGRITTEEFINKARKVHGDKYDYSKVEYKNNRTPVCIICHKKRKDGTEHGEFWQKPKNHLLGEGCRKCRNSKLERKVSVFLNSNNIVYQQEKTFEWLVNENGFHLYYDFYLPEYNVAIECQGIQHFMPLKENYKKYNEVKKNDVLKNKLSKENGVKILFFSDKVICEKYLKENNNIYYNIESLLNEIKKC